MVNSPNSSPPKPGMGSTVRHGKRLRLFSILFAVLLVGCSRDPNLRKQAYVASGNKYFDQGKYREAAIEYLNAVQIDNSYEDAHYRLAQCYLRQGIWRGAYQELTKSTELKPDDEKAQIGLGNLLLSSKQFKDAQAHAEEVLKRDPQSVDGHILMANSDAALEDVQQSLREMQTAIQLAPDKPGSYLDLALLESNAQQTGSRGTELP